MDNFIQKITKTLEKNSIPYMEIIQDDNKKYDATIKVYYPKILLLICKELDKNFTLMDKKSIFLQKDIDGYSFVDLSFNMDKKIKKIRLTAILKNTWGIADNFLQKA